MLLCQTYSEAVLWKIIAVAVMVLPQGNAQAAEVQVSAVAVVARNDIGKKSDNTQVIQQKS